ncbi:MAG: FitA-like ribbon-helix-helix domain-containing protein [Fidelibacterota bacterium]
MPSLQVRDVPEALYRKLTQRAKEQHRSIAQETIHILSEKLEIEETPKWKREKIFKSTKELNKKYNIKSYDLPNVVQLVREDRDR